MNKQKLRALIDHLKGRLKGLCCRMIAYEAPDYFEAVEIPGRPVPCPMHLDDGVYFTFDKNGNDTGAAYCPRCGVYTDMIDFLMKVNNLTFFEALDTIQDWLERYERSIRTGRPDAVTGPIYMAIPETPVIHHRRKVNRFTEIRLRMDAEQQAGKPALKPPEPKEVPIEVKPPEPKRPPLAERLGKKRPLPWSDHQ